MIPIEIRKWGIIRKKRGGPGLRSLLLMTILTVTKYKPKLFFSVGTIPKTRCLTASAGVLLF